MFYFSKEMLRLENLPKFKFIYNIKVISNTSKFKTFAKWKLLFVYNVPSKGILFIQRVLSYRKDFRRK